MNLSRFVPALLVTLVCLTFVGRAAAADKPTIESFDSDGVKIAYFVEGKGEPVVLIHG